MIVDAIFISCGKNLIISSGAENKFCLRRPYDIINLLSVLGIKNGEETVSLNPLNAIAHSERQKKIRPTTQ